MSNSFESNEDFRYCFTMKSICDSCGSFKPAISCTNKLLNETNSLLGYGSTLSTYERLVVNNRIWVINFVKELMTNENLIDDELTDVFEGMTEAFGLFAAMIPKCTANSDDRSDYIDEVKAVYQGYKYKGGTAESNIKLLFAYMEGEALHLLYKYAPSEF